MEKTVIVKGRLSDSRHVVLEEPVTGVSADVEVVLKQDTPSDKDEEDILELIRNLKPGTRSKVEIDRQMLEERSSWGDR